MYRKDIIELLRGRPWSLRELAQHLGQPVKDTEEDLRHLFQSLRHEPARVEITPARCRKCSFDFDDRHLGRPGKCPACRSTWIADALIAIA